eukprot:gene31645-6842_t
MPLIYSFVARGAEGAHAILAEYTPFSGNFNTVAIEILHKIPNPDSKFTIACDAHTFNFVVSNGFTFLVVADEAYGRQVLGCDMPQQVYSTPQTGVQQVYIMPQQVYSTPQTGVRQVYIMPQQVYSTPQTGVRQVYIMPQQVYSTPQTGVRQVYIMPQQVSSTPQTGVQ